MAIDDRDWYRDILRERQGLKPKYSVRRSDSLEDKKPPFVKPASPSGSWHPILQILLFLVICLITVFFLSLFRR